MASTFATARLGADSTSTALEKAAACGLPGKQSWVCSTAYDITGDRRVAEILDDLAKPLKVLLILVVAYLLVRILRLVIRRIVRRLAAEGTDEKIDALRRRTGLSFLDTGPVRGVRRRLRAETIGAVLRSAAAIVIWATAVLMVLEELGVNLAPLIAGAGVLGIAIGFGAQSLVRDFLSGAFMLIEDQYGVGDVIDVGEASGTVEGVSLRTTRLRGVDGTVWHVPNGEIRRVGNKSQQWSRAALLDVAIRPDTDIATATQVMQQVADDLVADDAFGSVVLAEPEVWGVEDVAPDRVLIRLVVKTKPLEQWRVARELRARLKLAFEQAGLAHPLPQQVTIQLDRPSRPPEEPEPDREAPVPPVSSERSD